MVKKNSRVLKFKSLSHIIHTLTVFPAVPLCGLGSAASVRPVSQLAQL